MKKAISLLLCLVMVFGLGVTALAEQPSYETVTGEYKYSPALGFLADKDSTYHFTYSDEYFTHSGYEYNHKLAKMTMDMVQSASVSTEGDWSVSNKNFYDLMGKCGFENLDANYYSTHEPTANSIGVNIGTKKIVDKGQTYTLLAVGVRGHGYRNEWGSNFELGYEGDHKGFAEARDNILSYMKDYIAKYKISGPIKIWITGYSRSAAAVNLTGGAIDQGYNFGSKVSFSPDNLYCYTFEAPQGTADTACRDARYWNIHNIVNANDLVPVVSPSKWGHSRFGIDYYLPCRQFDGNYYYSLKPKADAIIGTRDTLNVGGYPLDLIDAFRYIALDPITAINKKNVTQIEFFDEVIDAILDSISPTRAYFVDNIQNDLSEISMALLGSGKEHLAEALVIFGQKFTELDNLQALLASMTINGAVAEGPIVDIVVDLLMESLQEAGAAGYDGDQVRAMLTRLVPKLLVMLKDHPDTTITLLANILNILCSHCPEIGRAWLEVTPAEFFEAQSPAIFADVKEGSYCCDAAKWAYCMGIAKGYSSSTFAPNNDCTRAQVVTFLWRAAGSPEPKGDCKFVDVSADSSYYKAITWAAEKKIALGVDKTHFAPNAPVSRAEFVTFLWRNDGQPKASGKCPFTGLSSSAFYYKAVLWAAKNGITTGVDKTHFAPNDHCTRGQVVTFIYRDKA